MKKYIGVILLTVFVTVILARSSYTGYTRKSSNPGCTCHGSSPSGTVTVVMTGPAQVQAGSTNTYQVTISGGSGTRVCVDIAASNGSLKPFDTALILSGSELITNGTKTYTNGQYTYSFNYTAPATAGSQTLYATGLSVNSGGQWNFAPDKIISVVPATGIESNSIPKEYILEQNYPNPFNPTTVISYQLSANSHVTLKVYDLSGRETATLVDQFKPAGNYSVNFNAKDLSSGIYFYRLQSKDFSSTKKFMLMK